MKVPADESIDIALILESLADLTSTEIVSAARSLEDGALTSVEVTRHLRFAHALALVPELQKPLKRARSRVRSEGLAYPNSLESVFPTFGRSQLQAAERLATREAMAVDKDFFDIRKTRSLIDFGNRAVSGEIDLRQDLTLQDSIPDKRSFDRLRSGARASLESRREANREIDVEDRMRLLYFLYLGFLWWRHLVVSLAIVDLSEPAETADLDDRSSDAGRDVLTVPVPVSRRIELDSTGEAAASAAIEPLLHVAQALIDDEQLNFDDEAELRSLVTGTRAELINPRKDVVGLERLVGRLASFVASHTDVAPLADRLAEATNLSSEENAQIVQAVRDATVSNQIGDPNDSSDLELSARLLAGPHELLGGAVQNAVASALSDPNGPLAERLNTIDQRLSHQGGTWIRAIAQGLAVSALVGILSALGAVGIAFRAVVFTLIAIYKFL